MLDWLAHRAQTTPQKRALIFGDRVWSYAELNDSVARLSAHLAAAGVARGTHVAALLPNGPDFVHLIHALARLGAILIPLNLRLTTTELHWQLNHADATFLIHNDQTEPQATALASASRHLVTLSPCHPVTPESPLEASPLDLDATQGILFTSGTTGRPKGAMLSFANHFWSAAASAFRLGTLPDDCWLACMPLYHVGGQAILFRSCLSGTAVELHEHFDPGAVNDALDSGRITIVSLVPTMLQRCLDSRSDRPFHPRLRCILLGGAFAPPPLLERCHALRLPILPTYGLTEAASQVATALPGEPASLKLGSVGRPLMLTELRIANNQGQPLPAGEIGEILIKGPTVMRAYYQQPEATAAALHGGWLRTGDMGRLDDEGDLWVVQRREDLIVSGGENIYPAEVEAVLLTHPLIAEACVLGLPDDEWGQRVGALVVRRDPALMAAELLAYCREKLAGYKQPRLITFVDELPRTASGKVERQAALALLSPAASGAAGGPSSRR